MKVVTTLYLDEDLVKYAKLNGWNMSEMFNRFLATLMGALPYIDEESVFRSMDTIKTELNDIDRKIQKLQDRKQELLQRYQKLEKEVEMISKSKQWIPLITKITAILRAYLDFEAAWQEALPFVQQLEALGYPKNKKEEWRNVYEKRFS